MTVTVWPVNAVASAPSYSGRMYRQVHASLLHGATSARQLGARSGVRIGTPVTTVSASSTVWTVTPHAGILDLETAAEAGAYWYAVSANETGAVTAAHATLARKDIICVKLDDPAESDGSSVPAVTVTYTAGTASASPVVPSTPARSMAIATINVPASGGGSPTVTPTWPISAAAGGVIPVRTKAERDAITFASAEYPVVVDRLDLGILERSVGSGWLPVGSQAFLTNARAAAYSMGTNSTMFVLGGTGSSYVVFGVPESYAPLTLATSTYSNEAFSWNAATGVLTPLSATGLYELEFRAQASPQTGGTVTIGITKNTTSIGTTSNDLARADHVNTSAASQYLYAKTGPVRLTSSDSIRFISLIIGAAGAVSIGTDPGQTWFTIRRVGA